MNKIKVVNNEIDSSKITKALDYTYEKSNTIFGINKIHIKVIKSTKLDLNINIKESTKLQIIFDLDDAVEFKLNILLKGTDGKVQYKYNIGKNSICDVYKFNNIDNLREMNMVKLNGENSEFNTNFKTICKSNNHIDFQTYHEYNNTISNIKNNGVNIDNGSLHFQVSTFIPKNLKGCIANQYNRIINLTNNKCDIKPNLYIDSYDVSANHSALIGRFSDDEMFYLQSRGIDYDTATKMLISGFLLSSITDENFKKNITKTIDKYWR